MEISLQYLWNVHKSKSSIYEFPLRIVGESGFNWLRSNFICGIGSQNFDVVLQFSILTIATSPLYNTHHDSLALISFSSRWGNLICGISVVKTLMGYYSSQFALLPLTIAVPPPFILLTIIHCLLSHSRADEVRSLIEVWVSKSIYVTVYGKSGTTRRA